MRRTTPTIFLGHCPSLGKQTPEFHDTQCSSFVKLCIKTLFTCVTYVLIKYIYILVLVYLSPYFTFSDFSKSYFTFSVLWKVISRSLFFEKLFMVSRSRTPPPLTPPPPPCTITNFVSGYLCRITVKINVIKWVVYYTLSSDIAIFIVFIFTIGIIITITTVAMYEVLIYLHTESKINVIH